MSFFITFYLKFNPSVYGNSQIDAFDKVPPVMWYVEHVAWLQFDYEWLRFLKKEYFNSICIRTIKISALCEFFLTLNCGNFLRSGALRFILLQTVDSSNGIRVPYMASLSSFENKVHRFLNIYIFSKINNAVVDNKVIEIPKNQLTFRKFEQQNCSRTNRSDMACKHLLYRSTRSNAQHSYSRIQSISSLCTFHFHFNFQVFQVLHSNEKCRVTVINSHSDRAHLSRQPNRSCACSPRTPSTRLNRAHRTRLPHPCDISYFAASCRFHGLSNRGTHQPQH